MASAYFTRQSTVPTSEKKFTYSTWFKRGTCSVGVIDAGLIQWYKDSDERFSVFIDASNENPQLRIYAKEAGSLKANITSTQVVFVILTSRW